MANVYLRVPAMIAQYFRNRLKEGNPKTTFDPVRFGKYEIMTTIINNNLAIRYDTTGDRANKFSFSHREWKNMLKGMTPDGRYSVIKRDPIDYLSFDEVRMLVGDNVTDKSVTLDYLCIALPPTVYIDGKQCRVNPDYNLTIDGAKQLLQELRYDFRLALAMWEQANKCWCLSPHRGKKRQMISRKGTAVLNRFFEHYNIVTSHSERDLTTARKELQRLDIQLKPVLEFDITFECSEDKYINIK